MRRLLVIVANRLPRGSRVDDVRFVLYRLGGMRIGRSQLFGDLDLAPRSIQNVTIGTGCFLNSGIRLACPVARITIGDFCQIGPRAAFETVSHGLRYQRGKQRGIEHRDIVLEEGVWVGAGATILGGVRIGTGAVVAAGAVVIEDVPPHTLVGGVPARVLRRVAE